MAIFQEPNGLSVKFFLQKDIPENIRAELCEMIVALGGRIETKIPICGYILIQPGTVEAERLRYCWLSKDRPDRHFVPYTFVDACKTAGMLLEQIFVEECVPITMHIHPSINNGNARDALAHRIIHSGGDPNASQETARVILADPNTEVFKSLVKIYQGMPNKNIESHLWVKQCIERGSVVYTPLVYKNPGGRRAGEERTPFSVQDDENLCKWIALKIPSKDARGRTGNNLYKQLCDLEDKPHYTWVKRHSWQSWRERYKKNMDRLDARIAMIVEKHKIVPGASGQYGYVREVEMKPKKARKKRKLEPEPTDSEPDDLPSAQNSQDKSEPGSTNPFTGELTDQSPSREDQDDDSDWAVRIGDSPPPTWAKRKGSDLEDDDTGERKRSRAERSADRTVRKIALEFRFTVEEVQEYYNRCGDIAKTHSRFQRMREMIAQLDED